MGSRARETPGGSRTCLLLISRTRPTPIAPALALPRASLVHSKLICVCSFSLACRSVCAHCVLRPPPTNGDKGQRLRNLATCVHGALLFAARFAYTGVFIKK